MPMCGFNKKMLLGISRFQEGLVEHGIFYRSEIREQSFDETLDKEISDMDRFRKEIPNINDPEMRKVTEALTNYAYAFYKLVKKKNIKNYKSTINFLNKFFFEMDRKYYEELEGDPKDMKKLVEHLNTLL